MLSDVTEREYVGTALTIQTAVGFTVTAVSIQIVPLLAGIWGWKYAFVLLALGPVLGIVALARGKGLS
jgi:hypothetical protein